MATMTQLDKQIQTLTVQRDALIVQVNKIEQQMIALRKAMLTANDVTKANINKQLVMLSAQKAKITGNINIQMEDGEAAVSMAPSANITSVTAGGTSSIGGEANFPMRWGVSKKNAKVNVGQLVKRNESVYNFVDKLGSV